MLSKSLFHGFDQYWHTAGLVSVQRFHAVVDGTKLNKSGDLELWHLNQEACQHSKQIPPTIYSTQLSGMGTWLYKRLGMGRKQGRGDKHCPYIKQAWRKAARSLTPHSPTTLLGLRTTFTLNKYDDNLRIPLNFWYSLSFKCIYVPEHNKEKNGSKVN